MSEKSAFPNQRQNTASSSPTQSTTTQPTSTQSNPAQASTPAQPASPASKSAAQSAAPSNTSQVTQQGSPQGGAQPVPAPSSMAAADRSSSLQPAEEQSLYDRMNRMSETIARRAFELFESDGWADGRDREHWLRAEAEFLHPVHVHIKESDLQLTVDAELPGFTAGQLQYRLEPQRLTIIGRKETAAENKSSRTVYREQCSQEVLRVIELPSKVDASRACINLKDGVLEFTLPKLMVAESTGSQEPSSSQEQSKAAASGR
jgi:HSP20 family protein